MGDDKTLSGKRINNQQNDNNTPSLTIYAQSNRTGKIEMPNSDNSATGIHINGNLTINGGIINVSNQTLGAQIRSNKRAVTINGGTITILGSNTQAMMIISDEDNVTINGGIINISNENASGRAIIESTQGNVTISGGQVTVNGKGNNSGIVCGSSKSITLGYTNAEDFIQAPGYYSVDSSNYTAATPKIADGKMFVNESSTSTTYKDTPAASPNGIKLIPLTFTVKFDPNNGTGSMSDQAFLYGISQDLTANTFTHGGTFTGWNTKADGTGTSYTDGQDISSLVENYGEMTLYAQWNLNTYKIKYELNEGTNDSANPESYTVEDAITLKAPTREGYEFAGWTLDGKTITEIKDLTGDITLTAAWTPITYSITYNLDRGSATNPTTYTIETKSFTLNNPTKENYTFTGWTGTDLTAETQTVTIKQGSTGDREYTANYSENQQEQEQEQEQESQITLSALEVSVTGALTLSTTEGTAATSAYTASVTGKYSDGTSKTLDAKDYSLTWTLDKNISGIKISNNGTLSVNYSVKAGEYALKITAKATQDKITGSGVRSVNVTVSQQEQEQKSVTLESLNVSITGSETLKTTEGEALTSTYTANVTGAYSDGSSKTLDTKDYSLTWTLDKNISSIAINNNGVLNVNNSVKFGDYALAITAQASQGSIKGSGVKSINLSVTGQEQKQEQDSSNEPVSTTLDELAKMSPEEKYAIKHLELTDTADNKITDLSQVKKYLDGLTNLTTLDLTKLEKLEQADLSQLPESVKDVNLQNTNIISLNLNDSTVERVNAKGCENLVTIEVTSNDSLIELDVSESSISSINLQNCTSLKVLNCSSCDIYSGYLNLEGCSSLSSLDISRNHFGWFDNDESDISALNSFECYSQDIEGWESHKTFNFAKFFNSGDITTAGVEIKACAYVNNVYDISSYNESGDKIPTEYDTLTGIAKFESVPALIKYFYDTGFNNSSMDVTIHASSYNNDEDEANNLGDSGCGGCNSGLTFSSLIFAVFAFMFAKRR